VFTRVPTGFVPDEDQGYFIIVIQAPSGASLEYTKAIGKQVSIMLADVPGGGGNFLRLRASVFRGAAANQGLDFRSLEAVFAAQGEEHTASAIREPGSSRCSASPGAIVFADAATGRFRASASSADSSSWCRIRLRTNSKNCRCSQGF
jgi:HAE1 family hydrophobic/amphiphilic exporter-1